MVVDMERCMLKAKGMPAVFWGKAVTTAMYILNHTSTKALGGKHRLRRGMGASPTSHTCAPLGALAM